MVNDPRRRKQWQYMRDTGRPARCTEEERRQAREHVVWLSRTNAMSDRQISRLGDVPASVVSRVRSGGGITRKNFDKLMAVKPELPDERGGEISPVGAGRRVAALRAAGWPLCDLGRLIPASQARLRLLSRGKATYIHFDLSNRIALAYEKLRDADPRDYGVAEPEIKRAKSWSKNLAPAMCWDDDTIDDPDAIAEWTGACGTDEGYRIHVREGIPMCEPCRKLVELDEPSMRFSGMKLRILMDQAGLDARQMAEKTGASVDSIRRWSWDQRRPHSQWIEALAGVLDCGFNDLLEGEEGAVRDHEFNRVRFAEVLEEKGVRYKTLASRIGLSYMAVYYWLTGKNTPKIPKIVRAAEELGVDWKEFYREANHEPPA